MTATTGVAVENELEMTKTFRTPESLGRRIKVHAAQTGQKEKDILIGGCLVDNGAYQPGAPRRSNLGPQGNHEDPKCSGITFFTYLLAY